MSQTPTSAATPREDPPQPSVGYKAICSLGSPVLNGLSYIGGLFIMTVQTAGWVWCGTVMRTVRLGRPALYSQFVRVGVRSIGVIALVNGCIGLILALQMATPLADYGAKENVATIVAIAVVRELGPLLCAIVLTGFAGASIAAELGTMVVGEEIEALQAHALNPIRFLVVPRMVTTTLSLVVLCVFGDLIAIGGGYAISVFALDIPSGVYYGNTIEALDVVDFFTGLWKAAVFGLMIGAIGCYNGLAVSGGAAGVGRATTNTVVHSIVSVIVVDLIFVAIFYQLGWT